MLEEPIVTLRAVSDDDEDLLYRIAADLDTWEERSPASPAPLSLAAYRARRARGELDGDADFIISVDGRAVGRCTLFHEDRLARHAEVGIALLPDERGRGYGTEGLRQAVEFGFGRRNLRRLYLWVLASNRAAIASYGKVGFVEEGRHREHCWVRGRYEDEVAMGLLRSEWRG
ncbi:MAG: family N-acetyltransferase [Pseudonocardiales bacterium]|nr:family N-acetyltransferase [Pseudonocardiales bacterium]